MRHRPLQRIVFGAMFCLFFVCPCLSKLSVLLYLCIRKSVHPTMLSHNSWLLEHFIVWKELQVLREARVISPHPLSDWMEVTDWINVSHEAGPDAAHDIESVSRHWILFSYYFSPFPTLYFLFHPIPQFFLLSILIRLFTSSLSDYRF